jgi:hypothetical protein
VPDAAPRDRVRRARRPARGAAPPRRPDLQRGRKRADGAREPSEPERTDRGRRRTGERAGVRPQPRLRPARITRGTGTARVDAALRPGPSARPAHDERQPPRLPVDLRAEPLDQRRPRARPVRPRHPAARSPPSARTAGAADLRLRQPRDAPGRHAAVADVRPSSALPDQLLRPAQSRRRALGGLQLRRLRDAHPSDARVRLGRPAHRVRTPRTAPRGDHGSGRTCPPCPRAAGDRDGPRHGGVARRAARRGRRDRAGRRSRDALRGAGRRTSDAYASAAAVREQRARPLRRRSAGRSSHPTAPLLRTCVDTAQPRCARPRISRRRREPRCSRSQAERAAGRSKAIDSSRSPARGPLRRTSSFLRARSSYPLASGSRCSRTSCSNPAAKTVSSPGTSSTRRRRPRTAALGRSCGSRATRAIAEVAIAHGVANGDPGVEGGSDRPLPRGPTGKGLEAARGSPSLLDDQASWTIRRSSSRPGARPPSSRPSRRSPDPASRRRGGRGGRGRAGSGRPCRRARAR